MFASIERSGEESVDIRFGGSASDGAGGTILSDAFITVDSSIPDFFGWTLSELIVMPLGALTIPKPGVEGT